MPNKPPVETIELNCYEIRNIVGALNHRKKSLMKSIERAARSGWTPPPGGVDLNAVKLATVEKLIDRLLTTDAMRDTADT